MKNFYERKLTVYFRFAQFLRNIGFTAYVLEHPLYIVFGREQAQYNVEFSLFVSVAAFKTIAAARKRSSIATLTLPLGAVLLCLWICET